MADALAAIDRNHPTDTTGTQAELALTQEHPLIRSADEYGDLFARGAAQFITTITSPTTTTEYPHDHD